MSTAEKLRELPSVNEVLDSLADALARYPRALVVEEVRRALAGTRTAILAGSTGPTDVGKRVRNTLATLESPALRPVINATGVVLHTNLGRAPLGPISPPSGYSNLEYDLTAGRRGKRDTHIGPLIERLTGAPGIAVNNNAAAVFLALNELAAGGEAVVSRGELIEIGDGFRIPEIMQRSGAILREIGTTNRTSIDDYRAAITDRTRLLLRVHPSNFRMSGFVSRVELRDLAALGRERGIPVYEDLGSGCLLDLSAHGIDEPVVRDSVDAGADLVSFSGDKLLGGPQAGILAGHAAIVQRLRRNPLFRALRLDKLITHALETTLRNLLLERWDCIPALAMIRQPADRVRERAAALLARIPRLAAEIIEAQSVIGGGATPEQSIPTWVIAVEIKDIVRAEKKLRENNPPVIARVEEGKVLLDLRTVFAEEEEALASALNSLA